MKTSVSRALLAALLLFGASSHAGVNSWSVSGPDGGSIHALALHPTNPDILLATTARGLHRTADGGSQWTLIRSDTAEAGVVFDAADGHRAYLAFNGVYRSDDAGLTFNKLTTIPSGFLVGNLHSASDGTLFGMAQFSLARSVDQGVTWTKLPRPWPEQVRISSVTLDPNNAAVLYVTVDDYGTYRTADRGDSWVGPIPNSPGTDGTLHANEVFSLAVQPGTPAHLIAATNRGLQYSLDTGVTWTTASPLTFVYWVDFDPRQPSRAIALGLDGEIVRSADAGHTWPASMNGATLQMQSYIYGVIDPSTPNRLWAASMDGPLLSTDWGDSFTPRVQGMRAGFVANFSAANDGTVYAAFQYPRGVFRRDAGNWLPVDNDAMYASLNRSVLLNAMAVEPDDSTRFYVLDNNQSVARTADGGVTWLQPAAEFSLYGVRPLSISIARSDPRVAYVASFQNNVWKTVDHGAHWTWLSGMPPSTDVITVDPANPDVAYVVAGDLYPNALYRTVNGGQSWQPLAGPGVNTFVNGLTIDPGNSNVIYACTSAALYKSIDGGASWKIVDFGGQWGTFVNSRLLLIDPEFPSTLFAAGLVGDAGFLRSVDGGATWDTVFLPYVQPNLAIYKGVLDPLRPSTFIGDAGGYGIVEYEVATDLEVSLRGVPDQVPLESNVAATLEVRNHGPYAASPSDVRITLPAWLTPEVPPGCTLSASTLACRIPAMHIDETQSLPLKLAVASTPSTGSIVARVTGHEPDTVAANDQASVPLASLRFADLELQMLPDLVVGRTATLAVIPRLVNRGPNNSPDTHVTFNVPAGLRVDSATASTGSCSIAAPVVTCDAGDLAAGAHVDMTLQLTGVTHGDYSVTGAATGPGKDIDSDQNAASAIAVVRYADASIAVSEASADAKVAGTPFQYNVLIRNAGPDPVAMSGTLRLTNADVTTVSAPGFLCDFDKSFAKCAADEFAAGASVTMVVTANAAAAATVEADGDVSIDGYDSNAANNLVATSTTVAAPPPPPAPPAPAPVTPPAKSGGGGGGGIDGLLLALLALLVCVTRFSLGALQLTGLPRTRRKRECL